MSDPITQSMMQGAAGASGDAAQWVDEVFDIQTYKGTGTTNKRTSSVDNTKGGMLMWAVRASSIGGANRYLYDTVGGRARSLYPDSTSSGDVRTNNEDIQSFDENGFTLERNNINYTGYTSVIWNWRKAPGFFDCFEYTGTGADNNILNHKLKALPGLIIVKRTDAAGDWVTAIVWQGGTEYAIGSNSTQFAWNNSNLPQTVTAFSNIATANTVNVSHLQWNGGFEVNAPDTNASGATYMCYMWAKGDSDAAVYGKNEDAPILKCGTYAGNGGEQFIDLSWEPQFIMYRCINGGGNDWQIYDAQRGVVTNADDERITVNSTGLESSPGDYNDFHPSGWRIKTSNAEVNTSGRQYFYMAIRRPDGIVGKPAEAGTDVFAMDTGAASTTIPNYDSGFPVDFGMRRTPASAQSWLASARLIQEKYLLTDTGGAEASDAGGSLFDSNTGWYVDASGSTQNSSSQSWMWKRHAGFDVVTYKGDGVYGRTHNHTLGIAPEMIWIKNRGQSVQWVVGHSGMNNGTNDWNYYMRLDTTDAKVSDAKFFNTTPTSTYFKTSSDNDVNQNTRNYIAMLFASVAGISKCGHYTGNGSGQTITIGFQPRFLIIKRTTGTPRGWFVLDTARGWGAGNDNYMELNDTSAQLSYDFGAPTSTGFTLTASGDGYNQSNVVYIYYAHA